MTLPPLPENEKERLASLRRHAILDTPAEAAFDRIASLAARLFEVPVALVSLVDEDRQWFKATQGYCRSRMPGETRREIAFCAYTILSSEVFVVEDACLDPRFAQNTLVTGDLGLRFYAGAPLILADGTALGSLCLLDFQPRTFTSQQRQSLQDLAAGVVSELELRRTLATTAEGERVYRQMFEDSPQPMWIFDIETLQFLAVNDTAVANYGYSRDEFLARTLSDLRHPDDLAAMLHSLRVNAPGTRFVGLCRNFKKNGELVWTDIISHPITFQGHSARLVVATDVTERKAAEDAMHQSVSILKAQQEAIPDGILVLDSGSRILSYNQRLCEMFHVPEEIVQSGDDRRLLEYCLPQLKHPEELLQKRRYLDEHLEECSLDEIELWDGRVLDRRSGPAVSAEGKHYGRVWYFRDITERKSAEDALHRSLSLLQAQQESDPDGILVVDENQRVVTCNPRLQEIWPLPDDLSIVGSDLRLLRHLQPLLQGTDSKLTEAEPVLENYLYEVALPNGRSLDCLSSPILSSQAHYYGRLWVFRDVTERSRTEKALRASEQKLARHIQQTPLAVIELATDMTVTSWNPGAEATFGYTAAEAVGQNVVSLIVPEEGHAHIEELRAGVLARTGGARSTNYNRTKSGEIILCEWYNTPLTDDDGQVLGAVSLARDVTLEANAQERLRRSETHKAAILETAMECIISIDQNGLVTEWNPASARTFGYTAAEAVGQSIADLIIPPGLRTAHTQGLIHFLATGEGPVLNKRIEVPALHRDGREFPVELTATAVQVEGTHMFTAYVRDITERRTLELEREELLSQTESLLAIALKRADHDPLTGLLNHRAFHKQLKEEMDAALRTDSHGVLLLIDLDNFKFFNDAHGHLAGDDVLRQIAQALGATCRAQDTLARFGGDEFVLLLPATSLTEAQSLAEALRDAASLVGYHPPGYETAIPLSLSVGIACFPEDAGNRTALLEVADARLRVSKSGGDDDSHAFRVRRSLAESVGGFTMLDALVTAVDNKDRYTRRHSEDVMRYSLQIAREMGLETGVLRLIEIAALLHDVGKIGVPDDILRKPGRLTEEDYEAIKQHPMMGAVIVGAVAGFEETLDAVRHHHERWDGEGYPFGLHGEETPLLARLMAVADAYSAMTTDRPYRKGMDPQKAQRILEEGAGSQWDPQCVDAFLRSCRPSISARKAA